MAKKFVLDNRIDRVENVKSFVIEGLSLNVTDQVLHICYAEIDESGKLVRDKLCKTVVFEDYEAFISRVELITPGAVNAMIEAALSFMTGAGEIL